MNVAANEFFCLCMQDTAVITSRAKHFVTMQVGKGSEGSVSNFINGVQLNVCPHIVVVFRF